MSTSSRDPSLVHRYASLVAYLIAGALLPGLGHVVAKRQRTGCVLGAVGGIGYMVSAPLAVTFHVLGWLHLVFLLWPRRERAPDGELTAGQFRTDSRRILWMHAALLGLATAGLPGLGHLLIKRSRHAVAVFAVTAAGYLLFGMAGAILHLGCVLLLLVQIFRNPAICNDLQPFSLEPREPSRLFPLFITAMVLAKASIVPGLGHIFSGRVRKGVILLVATCAGYICFVVPGMVLHLFCIYQIFFLTNLEDERRRAVLDLCAMLGIELSPTHRVRMNTLNAEELLALRSQMEAQRAWPESAPVSLPAAPASPQDSEAARASLRQAESAAAALITKWERRHSRPLFRFLRNEAIVVLSSLLVPGTGHLALGHPFVGILYLALAIAGHSYSGFAGTAIHFVGMVHIGYLLLLARERRDSLSGMYRILGPDLESRAASWLHALSLPALVAVRTRLRDPVLLHPTPLPGSGSQSQGRSQSNGVNRTTTWMICISLVLLPLAMFGPMAGFDGVHSPVALLGDESDTLATVRAEASLQWRQAIFSPNSLPIGRTLGRLAVAHRIAGQYGEAEPLFLRSLAIKEAALGPEHIEVAETLNGLAVLFVRQARYTKASPLLYRALAIVNKYGTGSELVRAEILSSLGSQEDLQGQSEAAQLRYRKALLLFDKELGPTHLRTLLAFRSLAVHMANNGMPEAARQTLEETLQTLESTVKQDHPAIFAVQADLATVYEIQRDYKKAEQLLAGVLGKREEAKATERPEYAATLFALGSLLRKQGLLDQAEPRVRRAMQLWASTLGTEHPAVSSALFELSLMDLARGNTDQAVQMLEWVMRMREAMLRNTRGEPRIAGLLKQISTEVDTVYGLLRAHPDHVPAAQLALVLSTLHKGRAAEAGIEANRALSTSRLTDPQRDQLRLWQAVRAYYGRLALLDSDPHDTEPHRQGVSSLRIASEMAEQELIDALAPVRALPMPLWQDTLGLLARTLPAGSVFVDIILAPGNPLPRADAPSDRDAAHYLALVLFPDQRIEVADLGEAEAVDSAVAELLQRLSDRGSDPIPAARAAYSRILGPLAGRLTGVRRLILSPEGSLNLVPFAALHDGNQFLLDRFELRYVTSGRELFRASTSGSTQPLVLADPDFTTTAESGARADSKDTEPSEGQRAEEDASGLRTQLAALPGLPGTRREAHVLSRLLPRAQVLLGREATEQALKQARAPLLLHIATHGIWLQDDPHMADRQSATRGLLVPRAFAPLTSSHATLPHVAWEHAERPVSRSALVLAGAAGRDSRSSLGRSEQIPIDEDGLLTTDEVRSLDLWGTQLVVLSACESGRGVARRGEGVYGLHRAFFIAGAETIVTSLWQVADEETSELMAAYYDRLIRRGQLRAAAMQQAMKEMRDKKPHPYYWAPFLVFGKDEPLQDRPQGRQVRILKKAPRDEHTPP